MKKISDRQPKSHLFVCTNERPLGKSCCHRVGAMEFFSQMKDRLIKEGIRGSHWISQAGCLGYCNDVGCTVFIYRPNQPAPTMYTEVTKDDFEEIYHEHIGR